MTFINLKGVTRKTPPKLLKKCVLYDKMIKINIVLF